MAVPDFYEVEVTITKGGYPINAVFIADEDHTWAMKRLEKWAHEAQELDI